MSDITLVTETGAEYRFRNGLVFHRGNVLGMVWKLLAVQPDGVPDGTTVNVHEYADKFGEHVQEMKNFPLGKLIYVVTKEEWRMSTPVVEVRENTLNAVKGATP